MTEEHESLVIAATRGDGHAVESLLRCHLPALRAFLRLRAGALLRQHESVSDLVQSVCREVLQSLGRFEYRGEARFRAWLFVKALAKVQDHARRLHAQRRDVARESPLADEGELAARGACYSQLTPSRVAMAREELAAFEVAFDRLDEDHREVITLVRVAGLSQAEAAEQMGRSEDAVRVLLQRALLRLSWFLSRDADE